MSRSTENPQESSHQKLFHVRGLRQTFRQDDWPTNIQDYGFELPSELIAQAPAPQREDSKLLIVRRNPAKGLPQFEDLKFSDLPTISTEEGLNHSAWVRNKTKVFEARLYVKRHSGSVHEIVLLKSIDEFRWHAIVRNLKKFDYPQKLQLVENPDITVISPEPNIIEFPFDRSKVFELCKLYGEMPLPPYIKERSKARDVERYQSVWAQQHQPGSIAAPTASLHFSHDLCTKLESRGVEFCNIELNIGLGTFEPLRNSNIHQNELHTESFFIHRQSLDTLNSAIGKDRKILCIGTTSMRCLESLPMGEHQARTRLLSKTDTEDLYGETNIYIKPGTDILYTSQLLTNFHLPESSLFVLVSTFAGSATLAKEAYKHAVSKNYRFFSYGDASLWL